MPEVSRRIPISYTDASRPHNQRLESSNAPASKPASALAAQPPRR